MNIYNKINLNSFEKNAVGLFMAFMILKKYLSMFFCGNNMALDDFLNQKLLKADTVQKA